ncbi:Sterol binding ankyrin repeat protein [Schizosaccharomyces pombe]
MEHPSPDSVSSTSSSDHKKAELSDSLKQLQLLQAFQAGDIKQVDNLLHNKSKDECTHALFISIQCANVQMVKHILSVFDVDVNAYDKNKNTPLHLAAMAGRQDIVEALLLHPDINYNLVNANNKKAYQVATSPQLMDFMKGFYVTYTKETAREFKKAFKERNLESMDYLMRHNKFNDAIDLNEVDIKTGQTYLHVATKAKDAELVKWLLDNGADPYRRDKFGKLPTDYTKDENMRSLLRSYSGNRDSSSAPAVPQHMSGYLKKWTNYKSGYKLRWFTLNNGVLSYYKNQDDASSACRGSINLKLARLVHDPKQPTVFQVIGKGSVRYSVKANSPVEAKKWIAAISSAIENDEEANKPNVTADNASFGTHDLAPAAHKFTQSNASGNSGWDDNESDIDRAQLPSRENFEFNVNIAKLQVETLHKLIDSAMQTEKVKKDPSLSQVFDGISNSFNTLHKTVLEMLDLQRQAEHYYKRKLDNAKAINALWAENLKTVVEEQDQIEERYHRSEAHRRRTKRAFRRLAASLKKRPSDKDNKLHIHYDDGAMSSTSYSTDFTDDEEETNTKDEFFDVDAHDNNHTNKAEPSQTANNVHEIREPSFSSEHKPQPSLKTTTDVSSPETKQNIADIQKTTLTDQTEEFTERRDNNGSIPSKQPSDEQHLGKESLPSQQSTVSNHHRKESIPSKQPTEGQHARQESLPSQQTTETKHLRKESTPSKQPTEGQHARQESLPSQQSTETKHLRKESIPSKQPSGGQQLRQESLPSQQSSESKQSTQHQQPVEAQKSIQSDVSAPKAKEVSEKPASHQAKPSNASQLSQNTDDTQAKEAPKEASIPDNASTASTKVSNDSHLKPDADKKSVSSELTHASKPSLDEKTMQLAKQIAVSFHGYEAPMRENLDVNDDRPKISLWGILKGMIGKDMTKMTLPVSFNEPTSLLQRVAEDMEYTELLDQASHNKDPYQRILYVAAFAASEYASTLNRVAKPFNPLLGETYEFCHPQRGFRFIVEQVSHHPPVGAAYSESANWKYYGESSVKSKFYGKSFDISPLGTWFLELRHPSGEVELYTWKKVTSSVVGIILGSPSVDNYGQMHIVNHSSGINCVLDFKPRGWRGTNAHEVKGSVQSTDDTPKWMVNGHWNDKIFGQQPNGNKMLLWQNHERPPRPFNLTPFAISLNALTPQLKPWLPPTDTRLRPDQRAMENGQYDLAASEKNRLEEKQRKKRRMREQGEMPPWSPRWFSAAKHPVTGEDYWQFNNEYWKIREEAGEAHLAGKEFEWPNVDDIF